MTFANTIWLVGLTLEVLCFRRLTLTRSNSALTIFVAWQFILDTVALFFGHLAIWSTAYWLGASVGYVLLLVVFAPNRLKSLSGLYWLVSLSLTVLLVTNTWLYAPWKQYCLALCAGALVLFAAVIGYATHDRWLPRSTWCGVALWSAGQIVSASFPALYGRIYPVTCAVALALFLAGTYASVPLYANARKLDHVRLPLGPRFNRRRLAPRPA